MFIQIKGNIWYRKFLCIWSIRPLSFYRRLISRLITRTYSCFTCMQNVDVLSSIHFQCFTLYYFLFYDLLHIELYHIVLKNALPFFRVASGSCYCTLFNSFLSIKSFSVLSLSEKEVIHFFSRSLLWHLWHFCPFSCFFRLKL